VPTLVNRAWGEAFFWDGRIATLEDQVLQPIVARLEMDLRVAQAVERLRGRESYRRAFREAFGRAVNPVDLARALAAYVRTIQAGASPFDRYVWGERDALPPEARAGLRLFRGKANCSVCHTGPNLTDEEFHNTGVSWGRQPYDSGRRRVTGRSEDTGRFKTPTLREIGSTAPYMHDGTLQTLEDVIEFYDRGGHANPYRDPELRRLSLTVSEKKALLRFLKSLDGQIRDGVASLPTKHRHVSVGGGVIGAWPDGQSHLEPTDDVMRWAEPLPRAGGLSSLPSSRARPSPPPESW
jgi:cytochrome c peroxidase